MYNWDGLQVLSTLGSNPNCLLFKQMEKRIKCSEKTSFESYLPLYTSVSFFSGLETAILILPSVQQWSSSYSVLYSHNNSAALRATFVFPNEAAATALTMKMGESSFPTSASPVVDVLGI